MPIANRRSFLGYLGAGAGVLAGRAAVAANVGRSSAPLPCADLDALVELIRTTPRRDLLGKAVAMHGPGGGGVHWRDLLAAAFLAGIRDVEPRPVGFQFHCVMMTSSAFDIAARAPAEERLAAALYNIDDFKQSQARDARGGDWSMPPAPPTDAVDVRLAQARLTEVLGNWDRAAADRASTSLAHCASLDQAFAPLWWFALRDFTNIGHNPIFAAQAHRTLQQIGWRHGRDVLRSLVHGLLDGEPGAADATFVANKSRAAELRMTARGGPAPQATQDLVAELRRATPDAASAAAAEALAGGLPTAAFWDGMRTFAAEQSWRAPGLLSAHATTSVNALRYIADRARDEEVRAMAVLQAAAWQVLYRDFLSARADYDADAPAIEQIEVAGEAVDAAQVFAAAGTDARMAARLALAAATSGEGASGQRATSMDELMAATRHWLLRKVHEHHDYKFAAALLEEMQAASPATAGRMFAASLGYLRKPSDPDHELWALVAAR